jgi:hypothetical protein
LAQADKFFALLIPKFNDGRCSHRDPLYVALSYVATFMADYTSSLSFIQVFLFPCLSLPEPFSLCWWSAWCWTWWQGWGWLGHARRSIELNDLFTMFCESRKA